MYLYFDHIYQIFTGHETLPNSANVHYHVWFSCNNKQDYNILSARNVCMCAQCNGFVFKQKLCYSYEHMHNCTNVIMLKMICDLKYHH